MTSWPPRPQAEYRTYTFSTPFRMMLNSGATFYFSPSNSVAVSGYLVKE
jgi:hypothetical protein